MDRNSFALHRKVIGKEFCSICQLHRKVIGKEFCSICQLLRSKLKPVATLQINKQNDFP